MTWSYVVPGVTFEILMVQTSIEMRQDLGERIRRAVHAEVTSLASAGQKPGNAPPGAMSADMDSRFVGNNLILSGSVSIEDIKPAGKLKRTRARFLGNTALDVANGDDWVYPGAAARGVFRDAVRNVVMAGSGRKGVR